jgi:hypothetical protein
MYAISEAIAPCSLAACCCGSPGFQRSRVGRPLHPSLKWWTFASPPAGPFHSRRLLQCASTTAPGRLGLPLRVPLIPPPLDAARWKEAAIRTHGTFRRCGELLCCPSYYNHLFPSFNILPLPPLNSTYFLPSSSNRISLRTGRISPRPLDGAARPSRLLKRQSTRVR